MVDFPIPSLPGYLLNGELIIDADRTILRQWISSHGYMIFQIGRNIYLLHRVICEVHHGPPPEKKPNALHRNDVRLDNRPENLYWGDQKDNAADRIRNGKEPDRSGVNNGRAKLSEMQVADIRRRYSGDRRWGRNQTGDSAQVLADEFGVSETTIRKVANGTSWTRSDPIDARRGVEFAKIWIEQRKR